MENELTDEQADQFLRNSGMSKQELIELKLTKEEGQTLYELLDVATKAGGLQAAKAAMPIVDKLMQAVQKVADEPAQSI